MHHYNQRPLGPLRVSASKTPEPSSSSAMRYNEGPPLPATYLRETPMTISIRFHHTLKVHQLGFLFALARLLRSAMRQDRIPECHDQKSRCKCRLRVNTRVSSLPTYRGMSVR